MSREDVLTLLENAARFLDSLADTEGQRVCPEHRVEHLGKSAYRVHLGLDLYAARGEPLDETLRTATHLARAVRRYPHPDARAWLFYNKWPDRWNCSNQLIDAGAICEALARVLLEVPEALSRVQRDIYRDSLEKSAGTYVLVASQDKPVMAQCLWGATGLARAALACKREDWAQAARAVVLRSYEHLRPDGSWSYYAQGGEPGSEDASAFYHSRCAGFALQILKVLGDDPNAEPHREPLTAALEFLLALHRADGTKSRAWEAKLWYFDGPAELASLPFDVHALALGERAFGGGRYGARAARSLELLRTAQAPDGSIHSGAERSFQCRTFWTAHVGLLGEVLDDLEGLVPGGDCEPRERVFASSGLGRLEHGGRVVLVRAARPAPSPGFGGLCAGGAIVADGVAGEAERRERHPLVAGEPGEFEVPGAFPSLPLRRWGLHWLRFSRWRLRCALRTDGLKATLSMALATLGQVLAWWRSAGASHFALDGALELEGEALLVRGSLAAVDGTRLEGARTARRYELSEEGLRVAERLTSEQPLGRVRYRLPRGARRVEVDGAPFKGSLIERRGVTALEIRYLI